jgi:hypothetical protein
MKFRRITVIAAATAMAVGALVGVAGTGTASAATPTRLCVDDGTSGNFCALGGIGQYGVEMFYQSPGSQGYSDWNYPTSIYPNAGDTGGIAESGTNMCLQIDAGSSPVDIIRLTACNGDDAEKWVSYYNPKSHRAEFQSYWAYHDHNATSLCMSFDITDGLLLRADPCQPGGGSNNWYQQFGTS